MPSYAHRVRHVSMAAILLSHVTLRDKGDYLVTLTAGDTVSTLRVTKK